MRTSKFIQSAIFVLFLTALLAPASTGLAGEGKYNEGSPDKIDLSAVFVYQEPDFNPNSDWEGAFTRASELLYHSTNGQVQLGTINFYNNCPQVVNKADVIIHPGEGGASAHVGGWAPTACMCTCTMTAIA